jgi:cation-transporting ATPase 13A2
MDSNAKKKGLRNPTVTTGNVVGYEFDKESFDRVISPEVRVTQDTVPGHN